METDYLQIKTPSTFIKVKLLNVIDDDKKEHWIHVNTHFIKVVGEYAHDSSKTRIVFDDGGGAELDHSVAKVMEIINESYAQG